MLLIYQDDASATPAVVLLDEVLRQGRKEECSDAGSANGDSGGEGSPAIEVIRNNDDGSDVTERQAES